MATIVDRDVSAALGAVMIDRDRALFRVWAPHIDWVELDIVHPEPRRLPLLKGTRGYHEALLDGVGAGTRYFFRLPDGEMLPDPASRFQPEGVHGPSELVDRAFPWTDTEWQPPELSRYVIYELHIGTFTLAGTFEAALAQLPYLHELGVTAVELMPVAQFAGERNWGYDGVFPFAVQNTYGGPVGLKQFVNACHAQGLAVVLDVVYNHFGPEGQVTGRFGEYYNDHYRTPWGDAINYDGPGSDEVRHFFLENARQWISEFHIDALRLDAVHAILDLAAYPFLTELADAVREEAHRNGRSALLIAESNLNDPRLIRPKTAGGHGIDAQWLDDFHHAVHTLITRETRGYYADYGDLEQLASCYREAFIFSGQYSAYRRCRYGAPADDAPFDQFVACTQNHDQVGNRLNGERLNALADFEAQKLAAAALLAAPFVPLLFMGEEYGEPAPFPYFVSVTNPVLAKAIRVGRKREVAAFGWDADPPDPQARSTFESARLNLHLREQSPHRELLQYYRKLLSLRCELQLGSTERDSVQTVTLRDDDAIVLLRHEHRPASVALVLSFARENRTLQVPLPAGHWQVVLDSADVQWGGPGSLCLPRLVVDTQAEVRMAPCSAILLTQTVAA